MAFNIDDAAAAALWALRLERDPRVEHVGVLYGEGQYTPPVGGGQRRTQGAFAIPAGSLRGLYHNHPPQDRSGRFSDRDKSEARRLGVPSYISVGSDRVLKYDPKSGDTSDVLAQFPMEEFRAHLMRTLLNRAPDDPRGLKR